MMANGSFVTFRGPILLEKPIFFVIFQGWGGGGGLDPVPPLDPCMQLVPIGTFYLLVVTIVICW